MPPTDYFHRDAKRRRASATTISKLLCWLLTLSALGSVSPALAEPVPLQYKIIETASHDANLFTQGLLVQGEDLVETSGGYGKSLIRRYRADTGEILQQAKFPPQVFAEGVTQANQKLYALTWKAGVCFVLDPTTLQLRSTHRYTGEGWGLAYDGKQLIMSDGSDTLALRNPDNFNLLSELQVTGGGRSWPRLNELEYAEGLIWANIWQDTRIIAIDPTDGKVLGVLDLSELAAQNSRRPNHSVLNGIAYDPSRRAYWVTGKLWPKRYLIEIQSLEQASGNRSGEPRS